MLIIYVDECGRGGRKEDEDDTTWGLQKAFYNRNK
jgi:hypothetical protein